MKIAVIDYKMSNMFSIRNALYVSGFNCRVTSDPKTILSSQGAVLPGVGSFPEAMLQLRDMGLIKVIKEFINTGKPFMGICLGMQLLTSSSEEGKLPGLGWISGKARRFSKRDELKVPHMGWNVAQPSFPCALTIDLGVEPRYYFVHSYYVKVDDPQHSIMRTNYGIDFDSAIARDNIFGVQFHPEKSHRFGMKILKNFADL